MTIHYTNVHSAMPKFVAQRTGRRNRWLSRSALGIGGSLALTVALATPAMSQEISDDNEQGGLAEIVVTAQKTEQSLQRVPLAVSVIGSEAIERQRLVDIQDIGAQIGGFSISQFSRTQTTISMRGAGSVEDSAGADQPVGVFIDDIYMGNPSTFDFDLFDLERVEVLKGPQGTIFGRNVVGGAINFITRKPSQEQVVKAELTYGRFNRFDARASVSGPIVDDKLFGLFSFSSRNSDGYTRNIATGNRLDQDDQISGRAKLRWLPTEDLEVVLGADYSRDKSFGVSRIYNGPTPPLVGTITADPRVANHNLDGGYDRTMWGVNGAVTYSIGQGEIVSLTSYRDSTHKTSADADGTPFQALEFLLTDADVEQFSQELRYHDIMGDLEYTVGLYYYFSDYGRFEDVVLQGIPGSFIGNLVPFPAPESLGQRMKTNSYAGFAQGTYSITDALRFTAGVRYSWEEKKGNTACSVPGLQCEFNQYDVPVGEHWSAWTPKFTIDADLADQIFGYATVSRGFKSGGFASNLPTVAAAQTPFSPEYAWNYELGLKTRWFDNRVQLNIALFHVDYTDLQVRFFTQTGETVVGNAGSAEATGAELEFNAVPVDGLDVFANYTYQDAKYNSLILEGDDFSGNRPIGTPEHSLSFGGTYSLDLAGGSTLRFSSDFTYKSVAFGTPENDPKRATRYKSLINASVSYTLPNQNWEIQLWGKNLTDERISTSVTSFAPFLIDEAAFLAGGESYQTHYAPPLTWGVTLRYTM